MEIEEKLATATGPLRIPGGFSSLPVLSSQ